MSASHVVGIIAAVANVIIGLALYTKNPRKATNRTFALIALGIGGWIVGVVLLEITVELFWFSFLSFFATLMGTGFLIFSRVFPSVEKKVARSFYVAAITPAALMGLLVFARRDLFVRGVLSQNQNRSLELELGPVFPVLVGYAIAMTAYAALALARKYARARGIEKLQLKYLFFGFSLFFVTVVSGNLVLPQLGVNHFVTFGPAMSLFFAGSTAYAIVKHRLLDLRLIILKSLGYSLTLFLAILAYAAGTLAIASAYPGVNPSTSSLVALVAAVFIVTPLRKLFARLTTALFARATYDPQDFTRQLARVISTEISLDALASSTVRLVKGSMRLSRVAFAVMENGNARVIVDEGFQAAGHAVLQRTAKSLEGESAMLVPSEFNGRALGEFRFLLDAGAEIVLPLPAERGLGGFLILGEKASGEAFTVRDFDTLEIVKSQVAAGLEKAVSIRARDDARAERIRELQALDRVVLSLSSSLDVDEVLDRIVEESIQVIGADGASVMLVDDETKILSLVASRGISSAMSSGVKTGIRQGISGWVAEKGEPLLIVKGTHQNEYLESCLEEGNITSAIAVPLKARSEVVGVLSVCRTRSEVFTSENMNLVTSFAAHAAELLENASLHERSENQFLETINSLSKAVDAKDHYTYGHSEAVTKHAVAIAREMRLPTDTVRNIEVGGRLHDIGKIGIPEQVLNKPGTLTAEERDIVNAHPKTAVMILREAGSLRDIRPLIHFHHERYDGGGYPTGLAGEDIPLGARIIAVADSFNAMTTDRPYRDALSWGEAFEELQRNIGTQFDPDVVRAFMRVANRRSQEEKVLVGG